MEVNEQPEFPVPLMWWQDGRLMSRSEVNEDKTLEFFSKEQLIDFALAERDRCARVAESLDCAMRCRVGGEVAAAIRKGAE